MIKITSGRLDGFTLPHKSRGNRNGNGQNKQVKNASRPSDNQVQPRAITRMTTLIPRQDKIKETFKDEEGNDTKEYIDMYKEGDCKENLLVLEKQLLLLGMRYDLYEEGK